MQAPVADPAAQQAAPQIPPPDELAASIIQEGGVDYARELVAQLTSQLRGGNEAAAAPQRGGGEQAAAEGTPRAGRMKAG